MARRVLCGTVALLVTLGVPAGYAHAAGAAPSCSDGNLAAASLSGTPTSVTAGASVVDSTRLTNTTGATLSNASFIMALIPPSDHNGSGTPQLAWRVDGGSWHSFGLSWSAPAGSGADWQSQVQYFGATFRPKASHTLDIRTVFTTASPSGEYQYDLAYSADPCSMNELGMNLAFSQYAQGWTQPHPQPTATTRKSTAPAETHAAAAPTSAPATTPSHSQTPKPSPTPTPTTTPSSATPSAILPTAAAPTTSAPAELTAAQPAAAARSNHTPAITFVALAAIVLLGGGLYVGRRSRRTKPESGDE